MEEADDIDPICAHRRTAVTDTGSSKDGDLVIAEYAPVLVGNSAQSPRVPQRLALLLPTRSVDLCSTPA